MARTKGSSGARTKEAIRKAGLRLIYRRGYEAMNLRQLADAVGIQQGSLYNHISSKQELLYLLMKEHMETILRGLGEKLQGLDDPLAQIKAFIAFHVDYHMSRRQEVYINNSELRSLELGNLRKIKLLRDTYDRRVIGVLDAGVKKGYFKIGDTKVAAFALIAMLTGICNWYKPSGRMKKSELIAAHTTLALAGIMGEVRGT